MFQRTLLLVLFIVSVRQVATGQLCTGSLGDPVVNITFGAGTNPGAPLKAATTNLVYTNDPCAVNGFYTVLNSMKECNYGWHVLQQDHTGDANGYFMLIDASFEPNDFYLDTVSGLCPNTTYEFGAWLLNLKNIPNGIRPDVKFTIETTTGQVLATYNSGEVPPESSPQWRQYGFYFTTTTNMSRVVLRMANRAPGGDGNDMALDDITFRPCGPKLTASVSGSNNTTLINTCSNDTSTHDLIATISAGYNAPAYQWQQSSNNGSTWADIPGAVLPTHRIKAGSAGTKLYRLTVAESTNITLATCRVASNSITVNVSKAPALSISSSGSSCAGSMKSLLASGALNYSWTGPNGFTANTAAISFTNKPGTLKYLVTGTDNSGCRVIDSISISVFEKPLAAFTSGIPACANTDIGFTNQSAIAAGAITQWQWNFGDGTVSNMPNPVHVFSNNNRFNVSLVVTSDKGCADTVVHQLDVKPLPEVNFILPKVCLNDAFAEFIDSSHISDGSEAGFSFNWNFGDANATGINPNSSAFKNPRHSYSATGVYQVSLTITSGNGCSVTTAKPFTVNGATPVADFAISGNLCSNEPVMLTNLSTVNFGNITSLEIAWDFTGNPAIKTNDPQPFNGKQFNHQYPVFGSPQTMAVQVKMVAYSGISCVSETIKTINLKASPQVIFNPLPAVCESVDPFILTGAINSNSLTGTGIYSGYGITPPASFSPLAAGSGLHNIHYVFTATNGCIDSAENTITIFAQPRVNAGPDRTLLQGGFVVLNATASGNNLQYNWTPALYIDNNQILNPKVSPPEDQAYIFTATSADNCTARDTVLITVLKTPVVPNAFSPNGDGINDSWNIRYLDSYIGVELMVFDRYGAMVYKTSGYSSPWNGTRNGKPLPVGTYYYIIDRKIAAPRLTGSVTIIR